MDGRKESKWCGWHRDLVVVAGVWAVVSTHTPLLLPIRSLAHALVAQCVVDRVIEWCGVVLVECGKSGQTATHKDSDTQTTNTTAHTRGCMAYCVCHGVGVDCGGVSGSVVMECGGMVD